MDKKKVYFIEYIKVGLIVVIISALVLNYSFKRSINKILDENINNRYLVSVITFDSLEKRVEELERDVNFLASLKDLKLYTNKFEGREPLEELLAQLMLTKGEYNQIRVLDDKGYEKLRLDNRDGVIASTSEEELQDKSDRYYFKELKSTQSNKTYFSNIDLNVEGGKLEYPFNPTMRIGRVIEKENGEKVYLIVNYTIRWLIENTKLGDDSLMVLDNDSYWLKNENRPDTQWGRFIDNRRKHRFSNKYPEVWNEMQLNPSGRIESKDGVFVYQLLDIGGDKEYYGVHYFPPTYKSMLVDQRKDYYYTAGVRGFILAIFLSLIIGYFKGKNKVYDLELYREATKDSMTGVYNRSFILRELDNQVEMYNIGMLKGLSVAYIDINNLKQVNDNFGHGEGDYLIREVARALIENTRGIDLVGRIGGDELLIILPNVDRNQGTKIIDRACKDLDNTKEYEISFAYGVEEVSEEMRSSEELLNSVDNLMYIMKEEQKKSGRK